MEVNEKYIRKYWYEIVRDQVSDELEEKGFNVLHDYSLDGHVADIYAEKGEDKRIIEIKKKSLSRDEFIRLHRLAASMGIKFQLAIADFRSLKPQIEIEGVECMLVNYMNEHHLYEDFGYSVSVDDVFDISYNNIDICSDTMNLRGEAVCNMLIMLDKEGDCEFNTNFPMTFNIQINLQNWIIEDSEEGIVVDSSSFYE